MYRSFFVHDLCVFCVLKFMGKLYIHAVNIHQGGGRSLMEALLEGMPSQASIVQLDSRMPIPSALPSTVLVRRVDPTIFRRWQADRWLEQHVSKGDSLLCFGNLPPLFRSRGHVTVFLQNRYLVDNVEIDQFPLRTRLRLMGERFWLSAFIQNVDEFVVQTPSMKRLLELRTEVPIHVQPFMAFNQKYPRKAPEVDKEGGTDFDFLYVASGEPHKNHRQLIEAWCLLAEQRIFPSLRLTVDEVAFPGLCSWMEKTIAHHGLKVKNLGNLPRGKIAELYRQARALIYASTFESFGLPLIEARQAGLPVLAAELDYVRDVVDPEESFNPFSAVSIACAVKRFLGKQEESLLLQSPATFLKDILERAA